MKLIKYNFRSFFYSLVICLGIVALMTIEMNIPELFWGGTFIIYLIILFEMFYTWFISREKLKQLDLPLISSYTKLKAFLNHLILPSVLLFSIAAFIFFNNSSAMRVPLVITTFIAYSALFINLKAFYLDKHYLESKTYFVYDLIEMMIYFLMVNNIINLADSLIWHVLFTSFCIFLLTLGLFILNIYQFNYLSIKSITLVIIFGLIALVIFFIFNSILNLNNVAITVLQFLIYYLLFGILRHIVEGSLNRQILFEYLSFFLLSIALLVGLTQV